MKEEEKIEASQNTKIKKKKRIKKIENIKKIRRKKNKIKKIERMIKKIINMIVVNVPIKIYQIILLKVNTKINFKLLNKKN